MTTPPFLPPGPDEAAAGAPPAFLFFPLAGEGEEEEETGTGTGTGMGCGTETETAAGAAGPPPGGGACAGPWYTIWPFSPLAVYTAGGRKREETRIGK